MWKFQRVDYRPSVYTSVLSNKQHAAKQCDTASASMAKYWLSDLQGKESMHAGLVLHLGTGLPPPLFGCELLGFRATHEAPEG